jgi:hypothetical protein
MPGSSRQAERLIRSRDRVRQAERGTALAARRVPSFFHLGRYGVATSVRGAACLRRVSITIDATSTHPQNGKMLR